MSDYTERTRNLVGMSAFIQGSGRDGFLEFDRWLASVKAEAWDEGFLLATRNNPTKPHPMLSYNPYREKR